MREIIQAANGKTLGYKSKNGSITLAQDASGKTLGFYDSNTKQTYQGGKARFKGDHTEILVAENQ
jgi:hypothetical protein